MKKIIFLLILISIAIYSQDSQKSPNVELPDFVITGNEEVQLPIVAKPRPDLISTVSEEFFKPLFSSEELNVKDFSDPLKKNAIFLDSVQYLNFNLDAAVGLVSIPKADLKINLPFTNTLINAGVNGEYQRAYTDFAGSLFYKGMLNFDHYFERDGGFLPGTIFTINGNLSQYHYNYYGSLNPDLKNNLLMGEFKLGLKNLGSDKLPYSAFIISEYLNLPENSISENNVKLNGFTVLSYSKTDIRAKVTYSTQYLRNNALSELNTNYLDIASGLNIKISQQFKIHFGMHYAKSDTNSLITPYGAIAFKLDKGISFFAEYHPESEFITNKKILEQNKFFDASNFRNFFFKKSGKFLLSFKFEYDKYYEIEAGFGYFSSFQYPYFSDVIKNGFYNLSTTEAKNVNGFINMFFHPGPYGWFYGEVNFQSVRDSLENQLPYYPIAEGFFSYGYKLPFNITFESKLKFRSKMYTDLGNSISIAPIFNVGLKLYYPFYENLNITLETENLLNQKSFKWRNYLEPPINILFGINYNW
jgi:hypothetical protein